MLAIVIFGRIDLSERTPAHRLDAQGIATGASVHWNLTTAPLVEQAIERGEPPREAWNLECVQQDSLNPLPCSQADKEKYAAPDAGEGDDADDALMKEMMK